MFYTRFDISMRSNNKIKAFIVFMSISIIITCSIYFHSINTLTIHNNKRSIDKIEDDITILYNYTETMSDFIVDNDNMNAMNSNQQYLELQKSIDFLMNENKELKNITKNFIKQNALNYLSKIGIHHDNWNSWFHMYNEDIDNNFDNNINKILSYVKQNYKKLFEDQLNIDYNNLIVSFNYYSENDKENYEKNKIIHLIFNESFTYTPDKISKIGSIYNYEYKFVQLSSVRPIKFI